MTAASPPSNPFVAGGMIEDSQLFVGRQDELRDIASRMSGVQPISINVVGKPRIGKSSLLYHFWQSWEQRLSNTNEYVVVYVSLQNAGCQTEKGFYQALADALLNRVSGWKHRGLRNPLQVKPFNRRGTKLRSAVGKPSSLFIATGWLLAVGSASARKACELGETTV